MEKLIERFSNGQAAVRGCGDNCKFDFKYCGANENCPTLNDIYEKLAQYEETGLTPDQIKNITAAHKEEMHIRCAEVAEIRNHLSNVLDDRTKIGTEYEQALIRIDKLNGKIEFLNGQIEAYQYCMNCRR